MAISQTDIESLVSTRAQESSTLEFKRAEALGTTNQDRKELIKDCTGFANAGGGTILYGVVEAEEDGVKVASEIAPVTSTVFNKDWISSVLRNGSSPPLNDFDVIELAQPNQMGRIVVVEIRASSTAHQNAFDHKYYQRAGAITVPMIDYQIRDVMGRRTKSQAEVDVQMHRLLVSSDLHRYMLKANVRNTGSVTLEKWWLEIDLSEPVLRDSRNGLGYNMMKSHGAFSKVVNRAVSGQGKVARIGFGDPAWNGESLVLHPGQTAEFEESTGNYPSIIVEVDDAIWASMHDAEPALKWRMYRPNESPLEGEIPFSTWCIY